MLWAGLKGVVPILLGTYAVAEAAPDADRIYSVVFVVVLLSVVVQGGLVPTLARAWKVPMRVVEQEPWTMGMRFRDQPEGIQRYVVELGSAADGRRSTTCRSTRTSGSAWSAGRVGWCRSAGRPRSAPATRCWPSPRTGRSPTGSSARPVRGDERLPAGHSPAANSR